MLQCGYILIMYKPSELILGEGAVVLKGYVSSDQIAYTLSPPAWAQYRASKAPTSMKSSIARIWLSLRKR